MRKLSCVLACALLASCSESASESTQVANDAGLSEAAPDASPDAAVGAKLPQGPGFKDVPTPVPAPFGSGPGSEASVIAHWDVVPYQTFHGQINVGVLAYHFNGIERVEFSADGGPWVAVHKATANPQTQGSRPEQVAVEEYWVTLDATEMKAGPVEIRAIAYPAGAGKPVVLQGTSFSDGRSSLILNADADSVLSHEVRYATETGDDTNDCKTEASACRTLRRVAQAASVDRNLDGAEILLGEGTWTFPAEFSEPAWTGNQLFNTTRWLTFASLPGADPGKVVIDGMEGPGDGAGLQLKLAHFRGLTFTGPLDKAPGGDFEDYLWFDHVLFHNPTTAIPYEGLRTGSNFLPQGYAPVGVFHTDVTMDDMGDGPRGAILARNVFADHTGGGHSSQSQTVVNYTTGVVFGSGYPFPGGPGIDYHGDIYQMWGRTQDIILYGLRTTPGAFTSTRGIVGAPGEIKDVAVVNVDIATSGWVFSFCGNQETSIDHFVVQLSRFGGPSDWCSEGGVAPDPTRMTDILIDRSVFDDGTPADAPGSPVPLPGVKVLTEG